MYNNNFMFDKLMKQKEEIENLIKNYQSIGQTPVNNFINTNQNPVKDFIEWRVLNENEEVDNLYVQNKTLFINDNMMILKGVDGSLEKWEIKKTYPIDKKDAKINELEDEIKKLKEMMNNEYAKSISTTRECNEPDADANFDANTEPKDVSEPISREEQSRTGRRNSKNV